MSSSSTLGIELAEEKKNKKERKKKKSKKMNDFNLERLKVTAVFRFAKAALSSREPKVPEVYSQWRSGIPIDLCVLSTGFCSPAPGCHSRARSLSFSSLPPLTHSFFFSTVLCYRSFSPFRKCGHTTDEHHV